MNFFSKKLLLSNRIKTKNINLALDIKRVRKHHLIIFKLTFLFLTEFSLNSNWFSICCKSFMLNPDKSSPISCLKLNIREVSNLYHYGFVICKLFWFFGFCYTSASTTINTIIVLSMRWGPDTLIISRGQHFVSNLRTHTRGNTLVNCIRCGSTELLNYFCWYCLFFVSFF